MKRPFANLNPKTIDEEIAQILHTFPDQQSDEDTRCVQDLAYLYRKEEILARAQRRLMIADKPELEQASPSTGYSGATSGAWQSQATLLSQPSTRVTSRKLAWPKIAAGLAAAMLLLGAIIGTISFFNVHSQAPGTGRHGNQTPTQIVVTPTSASAQNNILFSDDLSQPMHNFTIDDQHFFKNGTYHILDKGNNSVALVVEQPFNVPTITYSLTMREVAGDDTDPTNTFGLILCYNQTTVKGQSVQTFYTFEILNQTDGSQYSFFKYDNSQSRPWTTIWPADPTRPIKTGNEFHGGHDTNAINTVKIVKNGSSFTFFVNGQNVGNVQDKSYTGGKMGMVVNLKGTEVAFSNMLLTSN
jgi:hypothetical protein